MADWIRSRDRWEQATLLLLLVLTIIMFATFQDYGMSWDEAFSRGQGYDFLEWYKSGFKNKAVLSHLNAEYVYGALFNVISNFASEHSPFGIFETSHLLIAILGLISIFYAYRIGKMFGGPMAGFLAALIITLTPTYYGHSFMNPKDIPFASFYIIALYQLLKAYDELPALGVKRILITGIAIGLPMSVRPAGMILLGYFGILCCFWLFAQYRKNSGPLQARLKGVPRAALSFVLVSALAWIMMLAWWPYGQLKPIANPLEIFLKSTKFTDWHWTILYRGTYIQSGFLPWHYLPGEFMVTLPEFYPLGILTGLAALVVWAVRKRGSTAAVNTDYLTKLAYFVFIAFFPVLAAMVMKPIMYDGTRLFLFVLPPIAVVCGLSFAWLFTRSIPKVAKSAVALVLAVIAGATVIDMIRLHPYEYVFFNRSSGGLPAANGKYETEYWGTSYKEGIEWVMHYYPANAPIASIRVSNLSNPILTYYYLSTHEPHDYRFVQVGAEDRPNVVLSITRWNQHLQHPGRVIHVVERMGTPLLYVTEVRPPGAP